MSMSQSKGVHQRDLCATLRRSGHLNEAVAAGRRAVKLLANDAEAHFYLAMALADKREVGDAILHYARALELNPRHDLAWNNMGVMLEQINEYPSAEYAYSMAFTMNHQNHAAHNNLGVLFAKQGKADAARECFENTIAIRPDYLSAHFNLSTLKTYKVGDPDLLELEKINLKQKILSNDDYIQLNFTLGKAREDVGDYDGAFDAYMGANTRHYAMHPYNEALADTLHGKVRMRFNQHFFDQHPRTVHAAPGADSNSGRIPIFVVGMPRSGTTLIEQILSSHPCVFGAGEIMDLSDVIEGAPRQNKSHQFTDWCEYAPEAAYTALGRAYEERLLALSPEQPYVTDKMPGNYLYIGMIYKMLPHARIIHVMRDPMDSCFSCYARHFSGSMNFTYDLGVMGRYYARYMQMMQHWREVLPPATILDVRYEDVVADLESQSRRMLDFVGLPWDAACLQFHRNKRQVKTASMAQVSKPIYKTSVARWQRFGHHLDPLAAIVKNQNLS